MKKISHAFLLLFLLAGCSSLMPADAPPKAVRYPYSRAEVWSALAETLSPYEVRVMDPAAGRLETEWIQGAAERGISHTGQHFMGGTWRRRVRIIAEVEEAGPNMTELRLHANVQEKAPSGPDAVKWRPVPSGGVEEGEIFMLVGQRLDAGHTL